MALADKFDINTYDKADFLFEGEPKAKQSFRVARRGDHIIAYQSETVVNYENYLRICMKQQLPKQWRPFGQGIALRMDVEYIFSTPKSLSKKTKALVDDGQIILYKTTKPDLDSNLNKAICDAMQGIVFVNDSQIAAISASKKYGHTPCVKVRISKILNGA